MWQKDQTIQSGEQLVRANCGSKAAVNVKRLRVEIPEVDSSESQTASPGKFIRGGSQI